MNDDPFAGRLLPNETIVWSGRPRQGLMFTVWDIFLIPFSLVWGGFAIFWETMVLTLNRSTFMALWGIPFVLIGLFLIFGRLPLDAWLRTKVFYALTDRRVLILRQGPLGLFKALALDRLADVTLHEGTAGRGTVRFAQAATIWGSYRSGWPGWVPALDPVPQFLAIADAAQVFSMIQEAGRLPNPGIKR